LHSTSTLRTFIAVTHEKIDERKVIKEILEVSKKMLLPEMPESTEVLLGNFITQIFSKIAQKIDIDILIGVFEKTRKCRILTSEQSLALVYARLFLTDEDKITIFLSETSVNNKISSKVCILVIFIDFMRQVVIAQTLVPR
jgi:hypothetical protein